MVSRSESMKKLVISLGEAIGPVANVFFIFAIILMIFAILGISFYKETMSYCLTGGYKFHNQ
jgi:hypothetical protein